MSAKATAIAIEVKATAGRVRAAWPVEYFLPLADEYLRLRAAELMAALARSDGVDARGIRESGPTDG